MTSYHLLPMGNVLWNFECIRWKLGGFICAKWLKWHSSNIHQYGFLDGKRTVVYLPIKCYLIILYLFGLRRCWCKKTTIRNRRLGFPQATQCNHTKKHINVSWVGVGVNLCKLNKWCGCVIAPSCQPNNFRIAGPLCRGSTLVIYLF